MKQSLIIFACLFTIATAASAQKDTAFSYVHTIKAEVSDFTVDNLGNIYLISGEGRLKKLNPNGDSMGVFNDVRRYGKLHSIDVTNPLKVLLYYRSFGTIVVLDRFLNVRTTIDLRRENLLQVKAIGQAYDNNIWVFDEQESKLKKIGDDGKTLDQSADFRMIFDSMPSPQFIVDQNKFIYLCDSLKGIYLFDYFGAFKNRIALVGWTDFTVVNGILFGRGKTSLYRYEPGSLNLAEFPIPSYMSNAKKIKITAGSLYVLKDNRLDVYSYSQ